MIPRKLLALALLATFAAACGGGEPETDTAAATDDDEPAAAAEESAVGRCAVDARDGAPYGQIAAEESEEGTGERMYVITGQGGAEWRKKASNVRVVDCE